MIEINIGEVIKAKREELNITQAKLCAGICDTSTLSRIELGKQAPGQFISDALLERLGISNYLCYGAQNFDELEAKKIIFIIKSLKDTHQFKEALFKLEKLKSKFDCSGNILKQFVLWMQAVNGKIEGREVIAYAPQKKLDMLNRAIRITVPEYGKSNFEHFIFTANEIRILIAIANAHSALLQYDEGIEIYSKILDYTNRHSLTAFDEAEIIPLVTYNYSLAMGKKEIFTQALEISEIGIRCCIKHNRACMMGGLLINKSCALHNFQRTEEAIEFAKQSYYMSLAMGRLDNAQKAKAYIKETYNLSV